MPSRVAKISVGADGRITLDGKEASIEEVRSEFPKLAQEKGVVWYHREASDREPHPNAKQVIEAIIKNRLPISMSTKPDFSDVFLPDGTVKPR